MLVGNKNDLHMERYVLTDDEIAQQESSNTATAIKIIWYPPFVSLFASKKLNVIQTSSIELGELWGEKPLSITEPAR